MSRGQYDATILELWATTPRHEIARRLGMRCPKQISARAAALGLPPKRKGRLPVSGCGSRAKYMRGCHCDACTAAQSRYQATWRAKREAVQAEKPTPRRKATASELVRRDRRPPTGHGSIARAEAGCDCPRCSEALAQRERARHPNGPPMWRCGCDPYRLNAGETTTCPACGAVPMWATDRDQRRRTG